MSFQTVGELLAAQVQLRGKAPLLLDADTGEAHSYWTVYDQSRRWAAFFAEAGLSVGDRVAVVLPNRVEFAELFLGAGLAGITLCPYNPALTAPEVVGLVRRYGAAMVLTSAARRDELAEALPLPVHDVGPRGRLPAALPAPAVRLPTVRPDDVLVLVMTSGTSGGVKACRLSHRNLCWTSAHTVEAFELDAASRYLTPLPLFHVNAQVVGLLAAIQAGGAVAIGSRLPAAKLWEAAERCGATGMSSVPAMIHDLLAHPGSPPTSLRFVVCSSAPLPAGVRARFEERFGIPLLFCYGLSEAGCFISYASPSQPAPMGSVGRPLGGEVRIEAGEVLIAGGGVFAGYDGDPEATALALRDGWLHTGDCGSFDDAGFLVIEGRLKEMINRGGEKIAPAAVEAVLRDCPLLAEVAVFGVPDERLGEEVAAAIIAKPGTSASDEDLWDYCQDRLAEFETPKSWMRLAELPRGGTGKVLRRLLQEAWRHER